MGVTVILAAPSPRLRGEGRGEGASPLGSESRECPLTLAPPDQGGGRSTSPRTAGRGGDCGHMRSPSIMRIRPTASVRRRRHPRDFAGFSASADAAGDSHDDIFSPPQDAFTSDSRHSAIDAMGQ